MEKVLTIVIPSYNVEKYLEKTLESFIDDSILDNIEILVIDDGSKDSTSQIALKYQEKYPNTFRLVSKENGGHGSTINEGIKLSKGKYFKVVDGDDWVDTESFVKLVNCLKNCNSDYIITNYYEVNDLTSEKHAVSFQLKDEYEYHFSEICERVQIPMHSVTILTDILKDNEIRLDEHCFYVDVEYVLYPIKYVESVKFFDIYVYMYRLALATQSVSMKGFQRHIQNHLDVIMHLLDFLNNYQSDDGDQVKIKYIAERIARMVCTQSAVFSSYPIFDSNIKMQFKRFDDEVKRKNKYVYDLSEKYSGKLRMLHRTNFCGYTLVSIFSKIRNK